MEPIPFTESDIAAAIKVLGETSPALRGGVAARLLDLLDLALDRTIYRRFGVQSRRFRNAFEIFSRSAPHLNDTAQEPDDDWLDEFFEIASRRSNADLRQLLMHVFAREANVPGTIPLRYIQFMKALDKEVLEAFIDFCQWVYPLLVQSFVPDDIVIPDLLVESQLVTIYATGHKIHADRDIRHPVTVEGVTHWFRFPRGIDAPIGKYGLTSFGKMVYELLDPQPDWSLDAGYHVLSLWDLYKEESE